MRLSQLFEMAGGVDPDFDDEPEDDEAPHFEALRQTGFYGRRGAGCLFVARDTRRVLVGLRSKDVEQPHTYGGFGGAVNEWEDLTEAAEREAREETGYTGPMHLVPLLVFHKGSFVYGNYLAVVEKQFTPRLNWENSSAVWCKIGDWPQPMHFGLTALVNDPASMKELMKYA